MTKELLDRFEAGLTRLISELESDRVKIRQMETEADSLRIHCADRDRLEAQVAELTARVEELNNRPDETVPLLAEIEQLRADLSAAQSEAGRVSGLQFELESSDGRANELQSSLDSAIFERDAARNDLFNANDAVAQKDQAVSFVGAERDAAFAQLDSSRLRIQELQDWNSEAIRARDQFQYEVSALQGRVSGLEAANFELRQLQVATSQDVEAAQAVGTELQRERERGLELEIRIEELMAQQQGADSAARDAADLRTRLEAAIARETATKDRLDALVQRIEYTEALLENVEMAGNGQS